MADFNARKKDENQSADALSLVKRTEKTQMKKSKKQSDELICSICKLRATDLVLLIEHEKKCLKIKMKKK